MRDSRKKLQTGTIPSPQAFRAAATGIGQTLSASERTGSIRAQTVVNSCSPECVKTLPDSYPPAWPELAAVGQDSSRSSCRPKPVKTTRPDRPAET
jgi:hypothetical protein